MNPDSFWRFVGKVAGRFLALLIFPFLGLVMAAIVISLGDTFANRERYKTDAARRFSMIIQLFLFPWDALRYNFNQNESATAEDEPDYPEGWEFVKAVGFSAVYWSISVFLLIALV